MIIDGKKIAGEIIEQLKKLPRPNKFLGAVLVGEDPASISFLKQKEKVAKELGIDFRLYKFPESISQDELRQEVGKIANGKTCGGMIVQLPLPEHINKHYILNAIPREKDVDVLGERALGAFYTGRNPILPPAVGVVEEILHATNYQLQTACVAVVGLGFLVGKPIAVWLMSGPTSDQKSDRARPKELYLLDRGSDFSALKQANLVISGVGQARSALRETSAQASSGQGGIIRSEMLKDGAGVIDFGVSVAQTPSRAAVEGWDNTTLRVKGDLEGSNLEKLAFYTPTPGGTGPILVAKLFKNFFNLNS